MNLDVSIGEVHRLLLRVEREQREQGTKLDVIDAKVTETNGQVIAHEHRLNGQDREIRDLKQRRTSTPSAAPISDDTSPAFTKRDAKVLLWVGGAIYAFVQFGRQLLDLIRAAGGAP